MLVFARERGLTDADRKLATEASTKLAGFSAIALPPPYQSPDGRALLITIPMPQNKDAHRFTDDVMEMRRIAAATAAASPGLQSAVTGPAGLLADTFDVFSKIEGALLIVTASIVAIILLVVYRSPFLWIVPLLAVGIADQTAAGLIYLLAEHADLTVNGQSAGILRVLVFGAGTDYALLLIARYREELTRYAEPHTAMRVAIHRAGPAILASAGTVIIGMLCLLLAELNSHRGLGPVCAIGIAVALATMMTLLPAAMVVGGRRLFWPFVPRYGQALTAVIHTRHELAVATAEDEDEDDTGTGTGTGTGAGTGPSVPNPCGKRHRELTHGGLALPSLTDDDRAEESRTVGADRDNDRAATANGVDPDHAGAGRARRRNALARGRSTPGRGLPG